MFLRKIYNQSILTAQKNSVLESLYTQCIVLADQGKAMGCSTNTVVYNLVSKLSSS